MTLNLTGWHLQVRRCVWNRILLIVRNEKFKKHNKYTPNLFSFCANKVFPFSQLAWPRVKLIWGWVYEYRTPWFESDETALISCMRMGLAGLIGGYMFLKLWIPSPLPRIIWLTTPQLLRRNYLGSA